MAVSAAHEGWIVGTPAYMSPEQARGEPVDARADIWAFGCVLYEMLSGRQAFDGRSTVDILSGVLRSEPAPLLEASDELVRIVTRCLRKDPAERFATIAQAGAALEAINARRAGDRQPSIAVLPFANLSADPEQEYFSDGLAEEIINALVQLPGLKVIARTSAFSFKGQNTDVRRIAETLGVAHILDGSVRTSGARVRVTAQLVTASDGTHLWSQRYDRDLSDVFALQEEIAGAITASLRVKLGSRSNVHVPNPEAHEALLKGRHHVFKLTKEAFGLAGEYFHKAVQLDANYATAHAWLGFYWMVTSAGYAMPAREAMARARVAALRAVELEPSSADAHAVLCAIAAQLDYDWAEAGRRFRLATCTPAVSPEARRICGFNYLLSAGRPLDAAHECELALRQDPLNDFAALQLGVCLHAAGDTRSAFDCYRQAIELNDRNFLAHLNLGLWWLEEGRVDEAAVAADRACAIAPAYPWALACKAATRTLKGDQAGANEVLTRIGPSEKYGTPAGLCRYHMLIQDFARAAEWAAKAIAQRDGAFPLALQVPCARGLRASRYWPELAAMMNLS